MKSLKKPLIWMVVVITIFLVWNERGDLQKELLQKQVRELKAEKETLLWQLMNLHNEISILRDACGRECEELR